jgi:hypothetical protein
VIAPDDDGSFDLPIPHELVDREPGARTVAEPEPADSRGQALEVDSLRGKLEPPLEELVVGEQLFQPESIAAMSRRRTVRPSGRTDAAARAA